MSHTNPTQSRRSAIKSMFTSILAGGAGMLGLSYATPANAKSTEIKRNPDQDTSLQDQGPLFSGSTTHNGVVYISGKGYHEEGDIIKHTDEVLNLLEDELKKAGSSMDKVLKVNVYLADMADYDGMNEVYRGRFGDNPPVRTTVACYGGIPGTSLVEIDCIAAVD